MTYYSYTLDKIVKELKFVPYKLKKGAKHEVGKTYWNGYWQKSYKVIDINGSKIKVIWQDGGESTHMTCLDYRHDYELRPFESLSEYSDIQNFRDNYDPVNSDQSLTWGEIKALCCAEIIPEYIADNLVFNYFPTKYSRYEPNDEVYYYLTYGRNYANYIDSNIVRDQIKSPRKYR